MLHLSFFVIFCVALATVKVYSKYHFLKHNKTWEEANKSCELATPLLKYDQYPQLAENISLPDGDYWVGYGFTFQLFQLKGCVSWGNINNETTHPSYIITDGPGACFSACRTQAQHFGFEEYKCYCFRNNVKGISKTCTCNVNRKCYGEDAIAVYSVQSTTILSEVLGEPNDGKYVAFNLKNKTLIWKQNDEKMISKCQTSNPRETSIETSNTNKTWTESAEFCFEKSLFPLSNEGISRISDHPENMVWTGMFKDDILVNIHTETRPLTQYSILQVRNNEIGIRFWSSSSNQTCQVLCKGSTFIPANNNNVKTTSCYNVGMTSYACWDISTSFNYMAMTRCNDTSETAATTAAATTDTIPTTGETRPIKERDHVDGATTTSKYTRLEEDATNSGTSKLYLILYICLAVFGVFVLGAVVMVILLRRASSNTPKAGSIALSQKYSHVQDSQIAEDYVFTEPLDNTEQASTTNTPVARPSNTPDPIPSDEGVYDISGDTAVQPRQDGDRNVYSHLMTNPDDTYDTTEATKATLVLMNDDGNVYNVTSKDANEYNMADIDQTAQKTPAVDGIYDHVTDKEADA